jgi:transposase
VAQVLHAVAEGLSLQATARVFDVSESTVHTWLTRAGLHTLSLQDRALRTLHLTHVQLDELRFKLRGVAEAAWLPAPGCIWQVWVACDARTKLIPAFALGPRTHTTQSPAAQRRGDGPSTCPRPQ